MLAICIPAREQVHTGFASCLANLTGQLAKTNIKFELLFLSGSLLPDQREQLTDQALSIGATEILWLDSDMTFPRDVYHVLHSHDKDIVACNYATKEPNRKSVAFLDETNSDKRLYDDTGLVEVVAVGMGCMLVNTRVYRNIPKPWHNFFWDNTYQRHTGEDIYFANKARLMEYKIFVDCTVSKKITHLGVNAYKL